LPQKQVQVSKFQLHISYFLHKCKKRTNPRKRIRPCWKRYHNSFKVSKICDKLRDCRKSPKIAILAISHVMKSTGYEL